MQNETRHGILLALGALAGYGVLMATNPARHSLRDGLRCVARYRQIWFLPAGFAFAHSAFRVWRRAYEVWVVPEANPVLAPWVGWQPPAWHETLSASWLPAAESTAALFNCVVTTFPLSALAAVLYLINWHGHHGALVLALRRRLGTLGGWLATALLTLCAVAAVCKPILFGGLPGLNQYFGAVVLLRVGQAVDSLSFVFEYLLGVGVQIYVILICFAWIRGLTFDFDGLRRFALRRFVYVVIWTAVVMLLSVAGIALPLVIRSFQPEFDPHAAGWTGGVIETTRWLLSLALLLFCSMQLLLIFHNVSLLQAVRDHGRLLRRHGAHVNWFVLVIGLHFLALALADAFLPLALGAWTWPGAAWSLVLHPLLWTALASWFLASWVCLFRRCEQNRPDARELVRF